jgi:hypothetical protein
MASVTCHKVIRDVDVAEVMDDSDNRPNLWLSVVEMCVPEVPTVCGLRSHK